MTQPHTVALLDKRGRFLVAEPFFERGRRLVVDRDSRARVGDLVLVRSGSHGRGHAKLVKRLGRPDVAADVLEALMLDRGLPRRFDPAVERQAREARDRGGHRRDVARRDLRDLPTFTIDPATAKDFDDAISAQPIEGGVRVWVHIADVSAFVAAGSLVDREAVRRALSVYVPGRVEPMLPEPLSNDACSLVPHQDRLAVTVEMDLVGGRTRRAAFHRSVIRSDERLTYGRVDDIFAGREGASAHWAEALAAARTAAAALAARRARGTALELLDTPEPQFAFDRGGQVTDARPEHHTESHRLIEHLMIAANEQVAALLEQRRVPALYRVHERPEGEGVRRLVAQLASLDVATPPLPEHVPPSQAAELVAECSRRVDDHVRRTGRGRTGLTYLVLRALKQARYAPRNLGHAGLGLTRYCHFTSPIRRYPDLVCHRALLAAVGGGEEPPRAEAMEERGTWCSQREREALKLERDADRVAHCFLLERELFERGWEQTFDGEVTGVIGAGAFVTFGDGHEGLVPVRRLRGDWWELNEEGTILHGTRSGRAIRLGDPIRVVVDRVEAPRGRVDLLPADLLSDGG